MSWIGGSVVINDASKRELERAEAIITSHVRHNADLEEFPHMKSRNRIIVKDTEVFASFDDAEEYAESISNEWRRKHNICLPFKDTAESKETKKIVELKDRIRQTYEKRDSYIESHHVKSFKAAFIGCQCCGSKINREYLRNDHCPICRAELRSETVIKTIKSYDCKILNMEKKFQEEKSKQKLPVKYVVFYCEYVG